MTPHPTVLEEEDEVCPMVSRFSGWDDAQVIRAVRNGEEGADEELLKRRRFENAWSGTWTSDRPEKIVSRSEKSKDTLSQKLHDRAEVRKLYADARSGNKAQRNAAKYLLRTKFGQSIS